MNEQEIKEFLDYIKQDWNDLATLKSMAKTHSEIAAYWYNRANECINPSCIEDYENDAIRSEHKQTLVEAYIEEKTAAIKQQLEAAKLNRERFVIAANIEYANLELSSVPGYIKQYTREIEELEGKLK